MEYGTTKTGRINNMDKANDSDGETSNRMMEKHKNINESKNLKGF